MLSPIKLYTTTTLCFKTRVTNIVQQFNEPACCSVVQSIDITVDVTVISIASHHVDRKQRTDCTVAVKNVCIIFSPHRSSSPCSARAIYARYNKSFVRAGYGFPHGWVALFSMPALRLNLLSNIWAVGGGDHKLRFILERHWVKWENATNRRYA